MYSEGREQRGFSLVELSIVIAVLGVLAVMFSSNFGSFYQLSNVEQTNKRVKDIKGLLVNFVVVNKYMPCPDTDNNGVENRTTVSTSLGNVDRCTASSGTIPYLDLGLSEDDIYDEWNNLLRYAVNTDTVNANLICDKTSAASYYCNFAAGQTAWFTFSDTPPFPGNPGSGNYSICNDSAANCVATPASDDLITDTAIAVIVAYNSDGAATLANCVSAAGASAENCDTDVYYHADRHTFNESNFFDDSIVFISGNELKAKVLSSTVSWSSYTPTTGTSGLTPTVEIFDIDQDAIDNGLVPISNNNSPDVILVNRNVTTGLNLENGDDYIAIGNNLDAGAGVLEAGAGDDTVYIVGEQNSAVELGTGDDIFVLGSNLTNSLDAGGGDDLVWIQGDVQSGSTMVLGDGSDILWVGLSTDSYDGSAIESYIETGPDTGASDYDILVLENVLNWGELSAGDQGNVGGFDLIIFAVDGSGNRGYCIVADGC